MPETTVEKTLLRGIEKLKVHSVENPMASAEYLLCDVLSCPKSYLITHAQDLLTKEQEDTYESFVKRRSKNEPVWYITGNIKYGDLTLHVNEHTLIPRPETELIIERIAKDISDMNLQQVSILDVGTGSGMIILSLAKKNDEKIKCYASDISSDVLKVAINNAKNNGLDSKIGFRQGDLLDPWSGMKFDVIVANLPYIPEEEMADLPPDVARFEPVLALDGGKEGMEIIERFISQLSDYISKTARVYLEIGHDQGTLIKNSVQKFLPEAEVEINKDYAQIDRIAIIRT